MKGTAPADRQNSGSVSVSCSCSVDKFCFIFLKHLFMNAFDLRLNRFFFKEIAFITSLKGYVALA